MVKDSVVIYNGGTAEAHEPSEGSLPSSTFSSSFAPPFSPVWLASPLCCIVTTQEVVPDALDALAAEKLPLSSVGVLLRWTHAPLYSLVLGHVPVADKHT